MSIKDAYVITHKIILQVPLSEKMFDNLRSVIADVPTVIAFERQKNQRAIHVTYDMSQITFNDIERIVEAGGGVLKRSWVEKFRRVFIAYEDENAHINAKAPPPACCSKPPPGAMKK